jgi:6-phosphofructokinase 1
MGAHAVEKLIKGESGIMIGIESNKIVTYPISHAWEEKKDIDEDDYRITMTLAK